LGLCDVEELLEYCPVNTLIAIFIGERTSVCPEVAAEGQKIGKIELRVTIIVNGEPTFLFCRASKEGCKIFRVVSSNLNEIT